VIKSSDLSFFPRSALKSIRKKSSADTRRIPRKSFHASFVRTCSSGSERAANVIHLPNRHDAVGAKQLRLVAIIAGPVRCFIASPILSIFYDTLQPDGGAYRRARECEREVRPRPRGQTSAREVAGISNFTERGLTRPTRGGEKLG